MNRIVRIETRGAPPRLAEADLPQPGPGEVRVRLHAAALNFADLLMIDGRYQETPPYPFTAGLEGAGVIEAVGPSFHHADGTDHTGSEHTPAPGAPRTPDAHTPDAHTPGGSPPRLRPGMRVAVNAQGTFADRNLFRAEACLPIPDMMSFADAAGFQVAYGSSYMALTGPGALRAGQTVAVLGAGGGVGLTAVEIAAALGARVIAVARGSDKLAAAQTAGAAELLDSDTVPDLRAALRGLGGVDVVYDAVGDSAGAEAFGALRPGGRHLLIGFAGGHPPALPLNHALVKNISIHGFYWGGYRKLDPQAFRSSLAALFQMYEAGRLHPVAGHILPLDRVAEAYELLRARKVVGKVILTMDDGA